MVAKIARKAFTVNTTGGIWLFDDIFQCYTLEDVARAVGIKIPKETCIPEGRMKIRITESARFKRLMPIIYNAEHDLSIVDAKGAKWEGVRMHGGNDKDNTDACVLMGAKQRLDWVQDASAFEKIRQILIDELGTEKEMDLEIVNTPGIY